MVFNQGTDAWSILLSAINILFLTFAFKLVAMAQLQNKDVLKVELFTVGEFAKAQGISNTAAYGCIKANLVDSFVIGTKVFIANTVFTKQYKPNESPRRKKVVKSKKRVKR